MSSTRDNLGEKKSSIPIFIANWDHHCLGKKGLALRLDLQRAGSKINFSTEVRLGLKFRVELRLRTWLRLPPPLQQLGP